MPSIFHDPFSDSGLSYHKYFRDRALGGNVTYLYLADIAVHAVWDLICFTCDGKLNHGMMVQQSVDPGLLAECATNIALGIIAVMMIYRNREKIISIWDKKWSGR